MGTESKNVWMDGKLGTAGMTDAVLERLGQMKPIHSFDTSAPLKLSLIVCPKLTIDKILSLRSYIQ